MKKIHGKKKKFDIDEFLDGAKRAGEILDKKAGIHGKKVIKGWIYFWPNGSWNVVEEKCQLREIMKYLKLKEYPCEISSPSFPREKKK